MSDILERQAEPGWMIPYLATLDTAEFILDEDDVVVGKPKGVRYTFKGSGRWDYWTDALMDCQVPAGPIPQIHFMAKPHRVDGDAIINVLKPFIYEGLGWYDDAWLALVKWILFGFGRKDEGITRFLNNQLSDKIKEHWYRNFNLGNLLHSPCDWSAFVLQGGLRVDKAKGNHKWAKGTGFFSTPHNVCQMMVEMTLGMGDPEVNKVFSVLDPCCGTGSQLLIASNYSLRLFGNDIVYDLTLCCELNGYLFVPWMVKFPSYMEQPFEERYIELVGERPALPEVLNFQELAPKIMQQMALNFT